MKRYLNLMVAISPVGDGQFEARVSSEQGTGRSRFAPPFRLADVINHAVGPTRWRSLGTVKPITPNLMTARECGVALFEALFTGEARDVLTATEAEARALPDTGVRIRLAFDLTNPATAEVAALPWELMRRRNDDPLVVTMQTALVRALDVPKPIRPRPFVKPLRILVIRSNPEGTGALNLARESQMLIDALKRLPGIAVDEVLPVPAAIRDQLARGDYHVIHYMGHGDFQAGRGGMLLLENEDRSAHLVNAATFAAWLKDEPLRLVFLNACETGTTPDGAGAHPFAGVAAALIQSNTPAVVAMQFPITDAAAIEFARTFYTRIADGFPVDAAVAEGRKALFDDEATEWATPVLYLRPDDGDLFAAGSGVAADAAAAPANPPAQPEVQPLAAVPGRAATDKRTMLGVAMGILGTIIALVIAFWPPDPKDVARDAINALPASIWIEDDGDHGKFAVDFVIEKMKAKDLTGNEIFDGINALASDSENAKAQYILADLYNQNRLDRGSPEKAAEFFLRSAEGGVVAAQYWVGHQYSIEDGLYPQDLEKARLFLTKAASTNAKARAELAELAAQQ